MSVMSVQVKAFCNTNAVKARGPLGKSMGEVQKREWMVETHERSTYRFITVIFAPSSSSQNEALSSIALPVCTMAQPLTPQQLCSVLEQTLSPVEDVRRNGTYCLVRTVERDGRQNQNST
jgi:hypothetical protein